MDIKEVDFEFKQGIALIIGKKIFLRQCYKTDITVLHTAWCVSNEAYYIDNVNFRHIDKNKLIYISGHGTSNKSIANRNVKKIAKVLIDKNYEGKQDIYITSCKGRKIAYNLKQVFLNKYNIKCNIVSSINKSSITIKQDNSIKQYDVEGSNTRSYNNGIKKIGKSVFYNKNSQVSFDEKKMKEVNSLRKQLKDNFIQYYGKTV